MEEQQDYKITDKMVEEAITQEIYIQAGFKTSICIIILTSGAEVVGSYAPIETDKIDIFTGKVEAKKNALILARTQMEAISNWRQTLNIIKQQTLEAEKRKKIQEKKDNK